MTDPLIVFYFCLIDCLCHCVSHTPPRGLMSWSLWFMVGPVKTRMFLITAANQLLIYSVLIQTGDCDIPNLKFVMQTITKFSEQNFNTRNIINVG